MERDFIPHLKTRGIKEEEARSGGRTYPARRWKVERTDAWHNKFLRLLARWERRSEHSAATVAVASTRIFYRILAAA